MESYSGGLSSYGLVLMVARYLQEQSEQMDTGSLLMGFLDFYSNHFDPRTTGISVGRRCYFSREHSCPPQGTRITPPTATTTTSGVRGFPSSVSTYYNAGDNQQHCFNQPYKFDPLYIEDPMCPTNNVGRNCFRVFQIQRAWYDAWRLLEDTLISSPCSTTTATVRRGGSGKNAQELFPILGKIICCQTTLAHGD